MGFWVCNECGGKLKIILTEILLKDYNIDKEGKPIGKCLKKSLSKEYNQVNYHCTKCGRSYFSDTKLVDVAKWQEREK